MNEPLLLASLELFESSLFQVREIHVIHNNKKSNKTRGFQSGINLET